MNTATAACSHVGYGKNERLSDVRQATSSFNPNLPFVELHWCCRHTDCQPASMTHRLCATSKHSLRTRRSGISHPGQVCGPSGRCHQPHGICSLQHFTKVSVLMHLHQMIQSWRESAFEIPFPRLSPQDEDETCLPHAVAGAFLSTSLSAAWRQLEGALLTPKLPFKNLPCVRVSCSAWATPVFDNSRCANYENFLQSSALSFR